MSERERWVVYPLLFFAIAMILREHFFTAKSNTFRTGIVVCEQLQVRDADNQLAVHLGVNSTYNQPNRPRSPGSGFVNVYSPVPNSQGHAPLTAVSLWVSAQDQQGVIETFNKMGVPVVAVAGDAAGGQVLLNDVIGQPRRVFVNVIPAPAPAAAEDPRAAPVRPPVPPDAS